jgi:hypothetical protein
LEAVLASRADQASLLDLELLEGELGAALDEVREKDRVAFNAFVDQEVREIWEVRYWRRLLEGFIIWEDK